jgi:hypothetical protein
MDAFQMVCGHRQHRSYPMQNNLRKPGLVRVTVAIVKPLKSLVIKGEIILQNSVREATKHNNA